MAGHAHNTHGAHREHGQGESVVTAVDRQAMTTGLTQLGDFFSGSAGSLEAHDIGAIHQPGN